MFLEHPSSELVSLFRERPYQGAEPHHSQFLFVGLDANYSPNISRSDWFQHVIDYHRNGVVFWEKYGVHHPFLLPNYQGDGRRYHLNFSKIGFKPNHSRLVSFVELLDVPTVGRSTLKASDLNIKHLRWLNETILNGAAEHVFLSAGVLRLMAATKMFQWLSKSPDLSGKLPTLYSRPGKTVHLHLHFSNYGKFQQQMEQERCAISAMIPA